MKKVYVVPKLEAVKFLAKDVITASDPWVDDGYDLAQFVEN